MPQASTLALVLSSSALNEQDKLVTLLTDGSGLLRAVAPGAAKIKNRFGSLLELFTEGEFHYYRREDRELATLAKGEIRKSFFPVVSAAENVFYFYLLAEIVLKTMQPEHRDTRMYNLLKAVLAGREQGLAMDWLLLYFLTWLLRGEGLLFNPRRCSNCGGGDLERAWLRSDYRGLLCSRCRTGERLQLDREELAYIHWTARHAPAEAGEWTGRFAPAELIRILTGKVEYHGEFTLQSRRYLPQFR
ncbi:MAG: DNA repair protein RecO [Acidobacteria bacterium]|jgi:DNA repair protein RecO (recombination protein O)|nr:DNA repair protein RecO [Acidobacteriota bacterium]